MRRIWLLGIPIILVGLLLALQPAEGQGNLQDRVSALETQVAELQALVGSGAPASTSEPAATHTITGSITIFGDKTGSFPSIDMLPGGGCEGDGGYGDFVAGGNITVRDGGGAIIASGTLLTGKSVPGGCEMSFRITGVPEAPFYSIEIGRRGGYSISLSELESTGWKLDLSIGP